MRFALEGSNAPARRMTKGKIAPYLGAVCAAFAAACNCGQPGLTRCPECPSGQMCQDGKCVPGCVTNADCPKNEVCVGGVCLLDVCDDVQCPPGQQCIGGSCVAPPADAGCSSGFRLCGEACIPVSGCCTASDCPTGALCINNACFPPDGGSADAGSPPDAGTTAATCYKCAGTVSACALTSVPMDGGACPTGYSSTPPTCTPCWSCGAVSAYCVDTGCCGPWTSAGYVGGGCTCYGCTGFGYGPDAQTACVNAQANDLSGAGGWCPWPGGANTAFCGFAGYAGDSNWYDGGTAGGCDCTASCGDTTTCCVPKDWPVTNCAECCSGHCGACLGDAGQNCCT